MYKGCLITTQLHVHHLLKQSPIVEPSSGFQFFTVSHTAAKNIFFIQTAFPVRPVSLIDSQKRTYWFKGRQQVKPLPPHCQIIPQRAASPPFPTRGAESLLRAVCYSNLPCALFLKPHKENGPERGGGHGGRQGEGPGEPPGQRR